MARSPRSGIERRHVLVTATVVAVVLVVAALGVWLQFGERAGMDTRYTAGPSSAADRVDVEATIQRVDAAGRELTLRVLIVPRGALGDPGGSAPAKDLAILTSSSVRGDLTYRAHARISSTDLQVALAGGSITDYPFDSYRTDIEVTALADGAPVPVHMTLTNTDALFSPSVHPDYADGFAIFEVDVARSDSVLIFAVFMMAAMWALAIAVVIGTRFVVVHRRGLVWPALGWMAATLFALAGFRNTAPGSPPIGSLLDYAAFLWAEAAIAVCVITTVVAGAHVENQNEKAAPG